MGTYYCGDNIVYIVALGQNQTNPYSTSPQLLTTPNSPPHTKLFKLDELLSICDSISSFLKQGK